MPEKADRLVLEHLRVIRADVGGIEDGVREIKHRLTSLEGAVADIRRNQAAGYADTADQHARYDRLAERIEGSERRRDPQNGDGG